MNAHDEHTVPAEVKWWLIMLASSHRMVGGSRRLKPSARLFDPVGELAWRRRHHHFEGKLADAYFSSWLGEVGADGSRGWKTDVESYDVIINLLYTAFYTAIGAERIVQAGRGTPFDRDVGRDVKGIAADAGTEVVDWANRVRRKLGLGDPIDVHPTVDVLLHAAREVLDG